MSRCPYCDSEHFAPEATEVNPGVWQNKCKMCGLYSLYTESTEIQSEIPEPKRSDG